MTERIMLITEEWAQVESNTPGIEGVSSNPFETGALLDSPLPLMPALDMYK